MPKGSTPIYADRVAVEPNARHRAMADWLTEVTGYEVDVKSVQLSQSLTNEFRGTDADKAWREQAAKDRDDAKKTAKLKTLTRYEARMQRLAEEQDRIKAEMEAKRQAILSGGEPVAIDPPAIPAKKSVPAKPAAAKKAAPAKKAPAKKTAAAAEGNVRELRRPAAKKTAAKKAPAKAAANPVASQVVDDEDEF